jgi:hypothetical protein
MAVFATLFAALGRQAARVLTTALGWASTLRFGRVPRQLPYRSGSANLPSRPLSRVSHHTVTTKISTFGQI